MTACLAQTLARPDHGAGFFITGSGTDDPPSRSVRGPGMTAQTRTSGTIINARSKAAWPSGRPLATAFRSTRLPPTPMTHRAQP